MLVVLGVSWPPGMASFMCNSSWVKSTTWLPTINVSEAICFTPSRKHSTWLTSMMMMTTVMIMMTVTTASSLCPFL